jgi:hypothetical protein
LIGFFTLDFYHSCCEAALFAAEAISRMSWGKRLLQSLRSFAMTVLKDVKALIRISFSIVCRLRE